jgi:hypothetical protein
MLEKDPSKRITLVEILESECIAEKAPNISELRKEKGSSEFHKFEVFSNTQPIQKE